MQCGTFWMKVDRADERRPAFVGVRLLVVFERYLGNGSGAAPPSVKHHSILVSFLQHFILHNEQCIDSCLKMHITVFLHLLVTCVSQKYINFFLMNGT